MAGGPHQRGEYNVDFFLNVARISLRVRHFSRLSRSGFHRGYPESEFAAAMEEGRTSLSIVRDNLSSATSRS